ncbi:MAG TPA: aminodeoxychorismate synthase component I [Cyclobacteriaceae bacterium]
MSVEEFKSKLNTWGQNKVPFLFVIDFEMKFPLAWKIEEVNDEKLLFDLNTFSNTKSSSSGTPIQIEKKPIPMKEYESKFNYVMDRLAYGDSFLTNLTIKTEVKINQSLKELFHQSKAKYKLWMKDQFLVFSPEIFIQIRDNQIFSFPMKGTIDASIPDAKQKILSDQKEISEHVTMVDLIRNDLSLIASDVQVSKFRYIDEIRTTDKRLLQVSSEITGKLSADYRSHIGDILMTLLPAGSISGAPKAKTVEIIEAAEKEVRGYYTGVFGYFDGENLDSGVMIRFIEQIGERFFYRSGGGITTQSNLRSEYQEAIDKVYVPID